MPIPHPPAYTLHLFLYKAWRFSSSKSVWRKRPTFCTAGKNSSYLCRCWFFAADPACEATFPGWRFCPTLPQTGSVIKCEWNPHPMGLTHHTSCCILFFSSPPLTWHFYCHLPGEGGKAKSLDTLWIDLNLNFCPAQSPKIPCFFLHDDDLSLIIL